MRKIYLQLIALVFMSSVSSYAAVHDVNVNASNFSPNSLNVTVGDTIRWHFTGGSHTTTSTSVPPGANTWNSPISSSVQSFDYVVTVAGTYNYECTPHGFTASFVAVLSGIPTPPAQINFSIYQNSQSTFTFTYSLSKSTHLTILVNDITGKVVKKLISDVKPGGEYSENYYFDDLTNGIYIVQFIADNQRITRRLIIE